MRLSISILLLGVCTGIGCSSCPPRQYNPPTGEIDGGATTPVIDDQLFEAACKRFEELGCKDPNGRNLWEVTAGGTTCPQVFRNSAENGVNLHPECIKQIKTCEERHTCTSQD